jgi:hypothetical protein
MAPEGSWLLLTAFRVTPANRRIIGAALGVIMAIIMTHHMARISSA